MTALQSSYILYGISICARKIQLDSGVCQSKNKKNGKRVIFTDKEKKLVLYRSGVIRKSKRLIQLRIRTVLVQAQQKNKLKEASPTLVKKQDPKL